VLFNPLDPGSGSRMNFVQIPDLFDYEKGSKTTTLLLKAKELSKENVCIPLFM
jgi:hypothetical protein